MELWGETKARFLQGTVVLKVQLEETVAEDSLWTHILPGHGHSQCERKAISKAVAWRLCWRTGLLAKGGLEHPVQWGFTR